MLVRDIVEAARYRLGDTDKTGWSDNRLVKLVNSGQKDICKTTSVYRRISYIPLANNQVLYPLPRDCYDIERLEYEGHQLPIYSREDLENIKTPPHRFAIKSNLNRLNIELYPELTNLQMFEGFIIGTVAADAGANSGLDILPAEGVVTTSSSKSIQIQEALGVTTSITENIDCHKYSDFGSVVGSNMDLHLLVHSVSDDADLGVLCDIGFKADKEHFGFFDHMNNIYSHGTYGITTDVLFPEYYVTVFYVAIPPITEFFEGSLILDDLWEKALVHYVVGMARQDDNDEGNYKIGEAEMAKYDKEVAKAQKISAKSYTSQIKGVRETNYMGFNKFAGGMHGDRYNTETNHTNTSGDY